MNQQIWNAAEYETPMLHVLDVAVEQGFTTSGEGTIEDGQVDKWGDY